MSDPDLTHSAPPDAEQRAFDAGDAEGFEPLGLNAPRPVEEEIIARASASHEPLPMLEVICARLAAGLSPMLKSHNGFLSETRSTGVRYSQWEPEIARMSPNGCVVIANADWGGPLVFALDPALLHGTLAAMLGGQPGRDPVPARVPTTLEKAFARRILGQVADEAMAHFSRIVEVELTLDQVESPPQIASLIAGTAPVAICEMEVSLGTTRGWLQLLFPLETLESVRGQLSKMFLGERLGSDASWRDHFAGQISTAMVQVEAELHRLHLPLKDVMAWKPGVTIDLGILTDHEAVLRCSNRAVLRGVTGRRRNGKVALRVTGDADTQAQGGEDELLLD